MNSIWIPIGRERSRSPIVLTNRPKLISAHQSECGRLAPNIDLHDLIERDATLAPVVELGGEGGGMGRHLTGLFERAAVFEVGGDARAAVGVVPQYRTNRVRQLLRRIRCARLRTAAC